MPQLGWVSFLVAIKFTSTSVFKWRSWLLLAKNGLVQVRASGCLYLPNYCWKKVELHFPQRHSGGGALFHCLWSPPHCLLGHHTFLCWSASVGERCSQEHFLTQLIACSFYWVPNQKCLFRTSTAFVSTDLFWWFWIEVVLLLIIYINFLLPMVIGILMFLM